MCGIRGLLRVSASAAPVPTAEHVGPQHMFSLSISRKLLLLNLLAGVVLSGVIGFEVHEMRTSIYDARQDMIRNQTEAAMTIARGFAARAEAGEMSVEEAQNRAREAIRSIRYGNNDYIFVYSMDGIAQLATAEDGSPLSYWDLEDVDGIKVIQELSALAGAGGGFLSYSWPRDGGEDPLPKLSFADHMQEWDWFIGTGVYIDDLASIIRANTTAAVMVLIVALAVLVGCGFLLARSITRPLRSLAESIRQIRKGAVDDPIGTCDRIDEIGDIAKQTDALRVGLVEKRELEAQNTRREAEQQHVVTLLAGGLKKLSKGRLDCEIDEEFTGKYEQLRSRCPRRNPPTRPAAPKAQPPRWKKPRRRSARSRSRLPRRHKARRARTAWARPPANRPKPPRRSSTKPSRRWARSKIPRSRFPGSSTRSKTSPSRPTCLR